MVKTSKGYDAGKLNFISKSKETFEFIGRTQSNYGVQGYVLKLDSEPNDSGCISVSQIGAVHAQLRNKKWYSSQNIFILKPKIDKLINQWLIVAINKALSNFGGYSSYPTLSTLKKLTILLPINNEQIDFDFMESFIAELEAERIAELSAYLKVSGLDNYELSDEELKALRDYDSIDFEEFEYQEVFDKIVQGRRLKKDDQIPGDIPFVMSGVTNTGIVNFISNPVASFPRNSITLDIFGNAFYRPYAYGAGDDTGVYWNEENEYSKEVMLYITSSMSRSVAGKYDYGNKLRSSKSKNIKMKLPAVSKGVLDTDYMRIITNAVMKLAIKDVVQYTNERIETTKEVVTSHNTNY
ncbi:restriction endonuclease subunit S [Streptococcus alactolyticus]|uniref:restriction endonuclease subunit S n=1 Tax=Streptococcus alactolyticus TaxID=29389 RepID=UPI0039C5B544